jgi:hypothetical protein
MTVPHMDGPPCKRCKETGCYQTRVFDPEHGKRYIVTECASCHRQTWTVMEAILTKAEEYLLIAKLAANKVIEQHYEDLAQELRDRIAEAVGVGPAGDHHCEDQPRNVG